MQGSGWEVSTGSQMAVVVCDAARIEAMRGCAALYGLGVAEVVVSGDVSRDGPEAAALSARAKRCGALLVDAFDSLSSDEDVAFDLFRDLSARGCRVLHSSYGEIDLDGLALAVVRDLRGYEHADGLGPLEVGLRRAGARFGYRKRDDGDVEIDEAEAALVREAFEMTAQGASRGDVADMLNGASSTTRGGLFTTAAISAMLRGDTYLGLQTWTWASRGPRLKARLRRGGQNSRFVADRADLAIVDGRLWLEARWCSEDKASKRGFSARPRDDLLKGLGSCAACGAPLHCVVSNSRRALRCANYGTGRCAACQPVLMDRVELAVIRLLDGRLLAQEATGLGDGSTRRLRVECQAVLEDPLRRLPLDVEADREVADLVRGHVAGISFAGTRDGVVKLAVTFPPRFAAKPVGGAEGLGVGERVEIELTRDGERERERAERRRLSDAAMEAAAISGEFDVADDTWRNIAPILLDVDLGRYPGLDARRLFDGLLNVVATDGAWSRIPEVYGGPEVFEGAWRSIVRCGAWAQASALLERHFPGLIDERHLKQLATADMIVAPAKQARKPRSISAAQAASHRKALLDILSRHPDDKAVKRDVPILLARLAGQESPVVAHRFGVDVEVVYTAMSKLRTKGPGSFEPKVPEAGAWSTCRKLDDAQEARIVLAASAGVDPRDGTRPMSLNDLREWAGESTGVVQTKGTIRRLLRRHGVSLPANISQRRSRREELAGKPREEIVFEERTAATAAHNPRSLIGAPPPRSRH